MICIHIMPTEIFPLPFNQIKLGYKLTVMFVKIEMSLVCLWCDGKFKDFTSLHSHNCYLLCCLRF